MRFVTRKNAAVDRIACPWLIRRFIDGDAEFLYLDAADVSRVAREQDAIPYDVEGVELRHVDGRCSFESIMLKYGLDEPAHLRMAAIVHGADVEADAGRTPQSAGLKAIAMGFAPSSASATPKSWRPRWASTTRCTSGAAPPERVRWSDAPSAAARGRVERRETCWYGTTVRSPPCAKPSGGEAIQRRAASRYRAGYSAAALHVPARKIRPCWRRTTQTAAGQVSACG